MKKIIGTGIVLALAFSLTACSSGTASSTASAAASSASANTSVDPLAYDTSDLPKASLDLADADGTLENVIKKGVLVVATSPDNPPYEYLGGSDSTVVTGSEMYLAKYIADSLGVELQIETMDFSAVLTAVDTGKADLAMAGFGWKKDRAENFELSVGYSRSGSSAACHGLLVPADKADEYKTLADFSGKTVIAQSSSLQQMYTEDEIPGVKLELVTSLDQGMLDMQTGKADAYALSCSVAKQYAASSEGQFVKSDVEFDLSNYAQYAGTVIGAKKGETSLINAVNAIVEVVNTNDLYQPMYERALAEAGMQDTE